VWDEGLHPTSEQGLEAYDDEPVDEFLPCGSLSEFNPANAKDSDDDNPEVLGMSRDGRELPVLVKREEARQEEQERSSRRLAGERVQGESIERIRTQHRRTQGDLHQLMLTKGSDYTGKRIQRA